MALRHTGVATLKLLLTHQSATCFGGKTEEVFSLGNRQRRMLVPWAAKLEIWAEAAVLLQELDDFVPQGDLLHSIGIADDVHSVLRAGQQHIDTIRGLQESGIFLRIAANERYNDDLGLFSLAIVHHGDANRL